MRKADWRDSYWLVLCELCLVVLIFIADWRHLIPLSKTPVLLLLGWLSLRLRRVGWRSIGLRKFRTWPITLATGSVFGAAIVTFQLLLTQPILLWLTRKSPDLSDFRSLTGNLRTTLLLLAASWILAAFGEEAVYRAYLMNRVADVGKGAQSAWICSVLLVSALFGLAHVYQGVAGVLTEGMAGLFLSMVYLGTGRNLWVPIIAHGVSNTVELLLIFFGAYPGM